MALRSYLATEVALDHVDGLLTRREALHRLGLLGLSTAAASGLLSACAGEAPAPTPAPPSAAGAEPSAPAKPDYDVAAATARTRSITFPGGAGTMFGAYAVAQNPRGAVLVVHENRGLTDHIRAVAGRLAGDGYSALAPDLLSRAGGTATAAAAAKDATAALGGISEADLVADLRSGLAELRRRASGASLGIVGFCFGGGMVWQLLNSGPTDLAAAVPFYGPAPDDPHFTGAKAAVLGIFAQQDDRVNAGRDILDRALTAAGVPHEFVTEPDAGHAFFNDTGARYNPAAATDAYRRLLDWFGAHLG
ncbi:MAG: dienelactone hydrolase family protein [Pseudonocardia sp.]|nr:dienelactone hydrolase family protein [Pseudonocardia sp.]